MTIGSVFSLETVYILTGGALLIFALMTFADRTNPQRVGSGLFWLTLGIIFMFGGVAPYWLTGLLVVFLVSLDGFGKVSRGRAEPDSLKRAEEAAQSGERLFVSRDE